ncbi:MAG: hypothetical protein ABIB43_03200 [archaeon]
MTARTFEATNREKLDSEFTLLAQKDYRSLKREIQLATTENVRDLHLMHTIEGHAQEGHGKFCQNRTPIKYETAFLDDIIYALGKNVSEVKERRQDQIDMIVRWIDKQIDALKKNEQTMYNKPTMVEENLSTGQIEPLAGADMLGRHQVENIIKPLKGFYLGIRMDDFRWRKRVDETFRTRMHQGTTRALKLRNIEKYNLTVRDFACENYKHILKIENEKNLLEILEDLDLISTNEKDLSTNNVKSAYIQLQSGLGLSDDAAVLTASLMYGQEAGLGLLLADAIDTLDKCTPYIHKSGQDESMGDRIASEFNNMDDLHVSDDEVLAFIYLASKNMTYRNKFPSCSQRRFWQTGKKGFHAVKSHMDFVDFLEGKTDRLPPPTKLGYNEIPSRTFYNAYVSRVVDKFATTEVKNMLSFSAINPEQLAQKLTYF